MNRTTFAQYLRHARERAAVTQAALAEACGLTGSYISLLESGKKPAPSDRVARKLARALELDEDDTLRIVHLDRAPDDLRAAVERLRRQASMERTLRERTAEALFPLSLWNLHPAALSRRHLRANTKSLGPELAATFDRLLDLARSSPDIEAFQERTRRLLDDLPAEQRRRVLQAAPRVVTGATAASPAGSDDAPEAEPGSDEPSEPELLQAPDPGLPPDIRPGDLLAVDPDLAPRDGDLVLVEDASGTRVARWTATLEGVASVIVEVRRRLR